MISPSCEGLIFTKLRICKVSRKLKSRENFRIYSNCTSSSLTGPWREKTCLWGLWTTKVQTSLHICAVWSASLLFTLWKVFNMYQTFKGKLNFLASLCSWAGWFGYGLEGYPRQVFSRRGPTHNVSRFLYLCSVPDYLYT